VNGSVVGVIIAEIRRIITTAYCRPVLNVCFVIMPIFERKKANTGSSNMMPNENIKMKKVLRYDCIEI